MNNDLISYLLKRMKRIFSNTKHHSPMMRNNPVFLYLNIQTIMMMVFCRMIEYYPLLRSQRPIPSSALELVSLYMKMDSLLHAY